ncbi:hypothetical protein B0J11DRAFT_586825 [Dendryphion nanum]|uniref:DUF6606 domain-containing protein n=1 Tax=Dendryphion nanum TaxID=256645 RepID=A0A9P9CXK9_9PLEO|nr:hypothetical protein B0J11DRAFT_586825 [Dendryphion nanum]
MALFEDVFNHLVRPPKLSGEQDPDVDGINNEVIFRLIRAASKLRKLSGEEHALISNTDRVIFEAFETSPPSAEVLAAEGALVWDFPDCAAHISFDTFDEPEFQKALANFLKMASIESLRIFQAHIIKAQTCVVEERDTTSPALVSHLLIPLIEAIGAPADVSCLRMRVRDDAVV